MKQKFTPNHLIKHIYKETTVTETLEINEALLSNFQLHQQYQELLFAQRQLPKVKFDAKTSTLNSILNYSKQATLETY